MQLIKIENSTIGAEVKETVNARELHSFLANKDHFATWIKDRVDQFDFVENQDFVTYSGIPEKGRPSKEYALTLDMAKELSMVERNDKGKQARQYFIECERRAKTPGIHELLNNPAAMHTALLSYSQQLIERDKLISHMQPQVAAFNRLSVADGSLCITDAAKSLQISPKHLFGYLSEYKWIYRRLGTNWIAYQDKLQQGLLEHKITTVERTDGSEKATEQVRVTPKGLTKLAGIFCTELQKAA